jgi:hypothetical protein
MWYGLYSCKTCSAQVIPFTYDGLDKRILLVVH